MLVFSMSGGLFVVRNKEMLLLLRLCTCVCTATMSLKDTCVLIG